jgi:CheY-like chemotaxis protein
MMSASASNRQHILIAEPDRQIRELLSALLDMEGYETDQAGTLEEALAKVERHLYDIVLTDTFTALPHQPRWSAAQQLRQRCHPIPVGLLTAWQVDQDEAAQAGFAFVLPKPFDIDDLVRRITDRINPLLPPEQQQQAQLIRRYLRALSDGDWAAIRALCTEDVDYYPLTRSVFTTEREIKGIEAYLAYAQAARSRLSNFQIEGVVIFHHPMGLVARYVCSWQGKRSQRQWIAGSVMCRFRGERIHQIGVALNTHLLQHLLEQDQNQLSAK